MNNIKEFLGRVSSRKFLLSLGTAIVIICNKTYHWGLQDADIYTIAGIVALYIGVEGISDIKRSSPDNGSN